MNGGDGVVLVVIQITDDLAPNGRHLRVQHTYGWRRRLLLLDLARGKERLRKMAPAAAQRRGGGGTAALRQGFAKHVTEEEEV